MSLCIKADIFLSLVSFIFIPEMELISGKISGKLSLVKFYWKKMKKIWRKLIIKYPYLHNVFIFFCYNVLGFNL